MEKNQSINVDLRKENLRLLVGLAITLVAVNGFLSTMIGSDESNVYQDVTRMGTAAGALALSLVVVVKQGIGGLFGRSYLALAIGLACWFSAECIWGYYEIGLGDQSPFPSAADAVWLASYAGIGYYLFSLSKFYGAGLKKWKIIAVAATIITFSSIYVYSLVGVSLDPTADDLTPLLISVAYPILDAIMLVPAVLMVLNGGKGKLTYIPWVFIGLVFMGIADTLLGFSAVTGFQDDTTFITMVYNASYMWMAAGMIWHVRFVLSGTRMMFK